MQPIENTDLVSDGSFWLSQPPQRGGACLAPYRQVRRRRTFGVSGSNRRLLRYGHHRSGYSDVEPYMDIFHIDKGLLKGVDVEIWDATKLGACARSEGAGELTRASMYSGELRRLVFRGIRFSECSFARANFVEVTFRRCKFKKVDLTRALFRDCHFSDCIFENCDPYNCSFLRTVVDPAAFKPCYGEKDWKSGAYSFCEPQAWV